jgi:hypothetical protein
MAPTKAMARHAVTTLSLPANVIKSLPLLPPCERIIVNRESLFEKVSLAVARHRRAVLLARADMVKEH